MHLTQKILWLNHHYIRELPPEYVAKHLAWHYKDQGIDTSNGPALTEIVTMLAERCKTLKKWPQQAVISSKSLKVLMKQR